MTTSRRALVTGGSRGIGAAIATALAADGHRVTLTYRSNADAAQAVVDAIRAAGFVADAIGFDVADPDDAAKALATLGYDDDPFQIVVHNAGVTQDGLFPTLSDAAWNAPIDTSLHGFRHVVQPLMMPMARTRWGRIVAISSAAGLRGNKGQTAYAAAKAGLVGIVKSLAQEFARRSITVNAVAPGLIETDMLEGAPVEALLKGVPLQRLGHPDEVASVVRFLCSDEAAYVTGQCWAVDGGLT